MAWRWKRGPIALACRRCQRRLGRDLGTMTYPKACYEFERTGRTKPLGRRGRGRSGRPSAGEFIEVRCIHGGHVFWTLHDHAPYLSLVPT